MSSSSSSSSIEYSSSSSSWMLSSSSSSIDSSSSSSHQYSSSSSSSSSSLHDRSYERLLPFTIESSKCTPSWDVAYYGDYMFVGTGSRGEILRSSNRYHWGLYYKADDTHISAIHTQGTYLYAGTAPNGNVMRFDLSNDDRVTQYGSFGNAVVDFVTFYQRLFMALEDGRIYEYDERTDQWNKMYQAYASVFQMNIANGKMCLAIQGPYMIDFDGSEWKLINAGEESISSICRVKGETFVEGSGFVKLFEAYPQNRSTGISCIEQDGTSIMMGSSNKGRIYNLLDGELKVVFDTDEDIVYDLLNIDIGVNLASIGNKLFLIHCGEIDEESKESEESKETEKDLNDDNQNEGKSVVMTFPNGGEKFELGEDVVVQWSSTRNYNDAVKLALYKSGVEVQTIASQTTNDGQFAWTIPLSLEVGEDYKISIEWLSAGEVNSTDKDTSDDNFSVGIVSPATTTTTTTESNPNAPDLTTCRGIPVLVMPDDEHIIRISKDDSLGSVVLLTSNGRIIEAKESVINGYLTGHRKIRADVRGGMGFSNASSANFTYALYNKIVKINKEKEIEKWEYVEKPSAIPVEKISGVFVSPALYVQEDIGIWKSLIWTENKSVDTEITVAIKCADSITELNEKEWSYTYKSQEGEGNNIVRDLNSFDLDGQYAQIKVEMESDGGVSPSTTDVSLVYTTKQSSYFFTTTFALKKGSDINRGMVVAEISEPINTEVKIGVVDTKSNDWNDYKIIPTEKLFDIENYENLKVGVKLTSFDNTHIPEVSNFAIISSGKEIQRLNI